MPATQSALWLASSTLLLFFVLPAVGQEGQTSQASAMPDFSGNWVFDAKKSDDQAEKMRELRRTMDARMPGPEDGRMGGRGGGNGGGGYGRGGGLGGPGGGGGIGGPGGGGFGGGRPGGAGGPEGEGTEPGGPGVMAAITLPDELFISHQGAELTMSAADGTAQRLYTDGRESVRLRPRGKEIKMMANWGQGERLLVQHQAPPPPAEKTAEEAAKAAADAKAAKDAKATKDKQDKKAAAQQDEFQRRREARRKVMEAMPPPVEVWELVAEGQRIFITTQIGPADHRIEIRRVYDRRD